VQAEEKYSVLLGRQSFSVSVDGDGKSMTLVIAGRAYTVDVEDERERATRGISAEGPPGGVVESVMPGVVRSVAVRAGDVVEVGGPLLVLEAMKMENEIRSEVAGTVSVVHVQAGQTVEQGVPLVTLK